MVSPDRFVHGLGLLERFIARADRFGEPVLIEFGRRGPGTTKRGAVPHRILEIQCAVPEIYRRVRLQALSLARVINRACRVRRPRGPLTIHRTADLTAGPSRADAVIEGGGATPFVPAGPVTLNITVNIGTRK